MPHFGAISVILCCNTNDEKMPQSLRQSISSTCILINLYCFQIFVCTFEAENAHIRHFSLVCFEDNWDND